MTAARITQPGRYRYVDFPGDDPVVVVVKDDEGVLVASFPANQGDDVPISDMWGDFQPLA